MNIIHSLYILAIGLLLYIQQVYTKVVYEINVIPINNDIFEAGVNNQIRIALWSKTRNYPVSMQEIEPVDKSLIEVVVFSKDLRAFSHFHMEDFPHYNNETNLPTTANYFDIDYTFPIAGDYTISIKCSPYKRSVRVNKDIHVEGKKDEKMNLESTLLPSDPNKAKVIYYKPIHLENVKSIYRLPIIPHTLMIQEKDLKDELNKSSLSARNTVSVIKERDLKDELNKATGPIYGTKITVKNTLRKGFCSNIVLEFFRVELNGDEIKQIPVKDLFQYNNIPIRAILANVENPDFDVIQGNILNAINDHFPSCGSKINPPKEMVYGPNFGFSVPFRNNGLYHVIFEIAHSYNENTYLLTPSIVLRVAKDENSVNYAPDDYVDDDKNYDQFVQDVINAPVSIPTDSNAPVTDDTQEQVGDDTKEQGGDDSKEQGGDDTQEQGSNEKTTTTTSTTTTTTTSTTTTSTTTTTTTTDSPKTDKEKPTASKEPEPNGTEESTETTPYDPNNEPIPESPHGKIIILGVAGIITVSGLMFYRQKADYKNVETIPSEYKQIDNDDDDDEEFIINNDEKEMLDKRSVSLDIESEDLLDTEDYTSMENDD